MEKVDYIIGVGFDAQPIIITHNVDDEEFYNSDSDDYFE